MAALARWSPPAAARYASSTVSVPASSVSTPALVNASTHPRLPQPQRGPSGSTTWWATSPARPGDARHQRTVDHHPAAHPGAQREADDAGASPPRPDRSLGEGECPGVVDHRHRRPDGVGDRPSDLVALPVAGEVGEQQNRPLERSRTPRGCRAPPHRRGRRWRRHPGRRRPTGPTTTSGPPSAMVGRWSTATTDRGRPGSASTTATLMLVPPKSSPSSRVNRPPRRSGAPPRTCSARRRRRSRCAPAVGRPDRRWCVAR